MAEGGGTQNVLCRYFMNNVCNKADHCRFSHDPATAQPSMFCRYYLKGTCAYGDKCRYEHSVPGYVGKVYAPPNNAEPTSTTRTDGVSSQFNVKVTQETVVPSSQPNALSASIPVGVNNVSQRLPAINHNTVMHHPTSNGISSAREMISLVAVSITQFVAMILDAHRIPHNLPSLNNKKNMSLEDARSSAKNLQNVVIKLGSALCKCLNSGSSEVLMEFGALLVNFWAEAKEPCPNLLFTCEDLAQIVMSPDGRQFLEMTLNQLQHLMSTLKSLLNYP
ncbi:uncharacterized protein LOC121880015 [Homarus americanus]|uniref:RING-type E3 ubiquitin transferase n=1 Tax=Homarus americanus TaxID=6706 RepID=A0A8J5MMY5_HOMAM|nr:uncharacterized protein LOC121880015 [Homarus americanus]KAG7157371.1 E3 ubiquitin-protein ligase makorin-1-like [Homarus americanus]